MADFKLLINGKLCNGDAILDVVNPATEELAFSVSRASTAQAEQAVSAARHAFKDWSVTALSVRQKTILEFADVLAANRDALVKLLTIEQGKPLMEAQIEVDWSEAFVRHFATLDTVGRVIQDDDMFHIETRRLPLGVVAGIIPWNFPLLIACWKIAPALVSGNTIVIKPSPTTPATTLYLGELCKDIFPAGVLNIIADDNDIGPLLTSHSDVAKVSFTGSGATGKKIMASGASSLKRMTLEMGGNDAAIVLDDVDVKATAQQIFNAAFLNCGQVCLAIKRAYVHESIYDEMCMELGRIADAAVVGDGSKPETQIGPIQNKVQYDKVKAMLDKAKEFGKVSGGGEALDDRKGFFIRPTIIRDVTDGCEIVDEEQFGPILPVVTFKEIDEVIARSNRTPYGLGGSVWSSDTNKAAEIASRVESGTVWVNQHINIGADIPLAGCKQSGVGVELSVEGLHEFTQLQVINIAK